MTYIFIFKLFSQGLDLEPLSLLVIEGVVWIVARGHTSGFIFLLQQTDEIHPHGAGKAHFAEAPPAPEDLLFGPCHVPI